MSNDKKPVLISVPRLRAANPDGKTVFGGWLFEQFDIAGGITASQNEKGRVSTVAVKNLQFIEPIFVYDVVNIYAEVIAIGKTSITVELDAYCDRCDEGNLLQGERNVHVGNATFVYVAIEKPGLKREISL